MVELSKRLQAVADMVEPGSIVADVGCDHGYVAMYLVKKGISLHVLAMDVNRGPLERAREHVEEAGLSPYIELRLSDGLKAMGWTEKTGLSEKRDAAEKFLMPEADTLLTAGLGGRLAARILEESADKVVRMRWAVLQPQSEIWLVRQTLRKLGYLITDENMIWEEGKYYTVIKACNGRWTDGAWQENPRLDNRQPQGAADREMLSELGMEEAGWCEAADRFGRLLILGKHPVLKDFLSDTLQKNRAIAEKIRQEMIAPGTGARLEQLEKDNSTLEKLISWMQK